MSLCGSIHCLGLRNRLDRSSVFKGSVGRRDIRPTRVLLSSKTSEFNRMLPFGGLYISRDSVLKRHNSFGCYSLLPPNNSSGSSLVKNVIKALPRSFNNLQTSSLTVKLAAAVAIITFALWGLGPLVRKGRSLFLHKNDSSWKKSDTYHLTTSYIQPLLLWVGATLICRSLDPVSLPSPASQVVKQRLLHFVRSLSTVLALAYCLSSMIQQMQKFLMDGNDPGNARNMGFQFAGKATYTAVWIAAISLFMELLGFSTQKWLTAGGLGTVLLTLAGREIFTNFLSSVMIHATRPFVVNEWIQTRIEGYEVSGTVEHVGWWSPTIIRGEDREAVHIPNNKFTINVVRNLSQKSHWRIKTHLAISHLDVSKINSIVADMRKVLAKNPQVEQQRLHRRVFLDNINHENQALLILVSCFVKTSHHEEYLCVKEAILLDLLRVISHHKARLATPIRTMQRMYRDNDVENAPFADARFSRGGVVSNRPLLLIEPSYKITGEDKTKSSTRASPDQGGKPSSRPTIESKADSKMESSQVSGSKGQEKPKGDSTSDVKNESARNTETNEERVAGAIIGDGTEGSKANMKSVPKSRMKSAVVAPNLESQNASTSSEPGSKNSNSSHSKAALSENGLQNAELVASAFSTSDAGPGKGTESPAAARAKYNNNNTSAQAPVSSSGLQENIVLGVALDGGKRTLPMEEVVSLNSPGRTDPA